MLWAVYRKNFFLCNCLGSILLFGIQSRLEGGVHLYMFYIIILQSVMSCFVVSKTLCLHVYIDVYIYIYILHENPIDCCSPALVIVWNQNYMNLINQSTVIVLIVINPSVIVLFTKFVPITRDCPIVSAWHGNIFSLLALYYGHTRTFCFFIVSLNTPLNIQSWAWWYYAH